jgi:hypothetical protein
MEVAEEQQLFIVDYGKGGRLDPAQIEKLRTKVRQLEDNKGQVICQSSQGILRAEYYYIGKQVSIALEGTNKTVMMVMQVSSQMTKQH